MIYFDIIQSIVVIVCAGCIGSFIALRSAWLSSQSSLIEQTKAMKDLNEKIANEHNSMAKRLLEVEDRMGNMSNYVSTLGVKNGRTI